MNGIGKGASYSNITVENSMFQGHVFTLTCGGGCNQSGQYAVTSGFVHLYYNSFPDGSYFQDWKPGGDYQMIGNIFGDVPPNHGNCTIEGTNGNPAADFTVASYNMFGGGGASACGSTNFNGSAKYVNDSNGAAGIDLHLATGSPGIDTVAKSGVYMPSSDIDDQTRYCGTSPDVGADERC
jgi:hypothetical protein